MFEEHKTRWLHIAESLKPALRHETVRPVTGMPEKALWEGQSVVLDFGNHFVGRLSLKLSSQGSHPDAPAWLAIKFCENGRELNETLDGYHGWISKGWVQQEQLHLDVLPAEIMLPRRYAFRYVKIEVLALSSKYQLVIEDAIADTVTSADDTAVPLFAGSKQDTAIDRVALRTLRSCMQDFFEDGPKRDRRLWLGDLRLQALANNVTYRDFGLVKRCLYLFAATANEEGRVSACLFTEPTIEADDTYMFDYSLFFVSALLDYVRASGDRETGIDLLPVAKQQLKLAEAEFDENGLIRDQDVMGWCFIDWNLNLNKQASAQAVWIDAAKAYILLLQGIGLPEDESLRRHIAARTAAAYSHLYDKEKHLFVSGQKRQISWASQAWMVLAGVLEEEEACACLRSIEEVPQAEKMVTPYMMHHYVHALCKAGLKEKAGQTLREYWGSMVALGADTFWELFNPENPDESPYGSRVVNSYCHAWSCTPTWFLRSGILEE